MLETQECPFINTWSSLHVQNVQNIEMSLLTALWHIVPLLVHQSKLLEWYPTAAFCFWCLSSVVGQKITMLTSSHPCHFLSFFPFFQPSIYSHHQSIHLTIHSPIYQYICLFTHQLYPYSLIHPSNNFPSIQRFLFVHPPHAHTYCFAINNSKTLIDNHL